MQDINFNKYEVVWYKRSLSVDWDSANRRNEREYNGFGISVKNYTVFYLDLNVNPGRSANCNSLYMSERQGRQ
jgi:hypothetical protein